MKDDKLGPYGCLCKTLHHKLTGDGCSICNPEHVDSESLDLDYYKTVATTQTDPEILLLELIDLIKDIEQDRERIKREIEKLESPSKSALFTCGFQQCVKEVLAIVDNKNVEKTEGE